MKVRVGITGWSPLPETEPGAMARNFGNPFLDPTRNFKYDKTLSTNKNILLDE